MATDKTSTLRLRLDIGALKALERDARELGIAPGTLARRLLEARYSLPPTVGNSHRRMDISHRSEVVDLP